MGIHITEANVRCEFTGKCLRQHLRIIRAKKHWEMREGFLRECDEKKNHGIMLQDLKVHAN